MKFFDKNEKKEIELEEKDGNDQQDYKSDFESYIDKKFDEMIEIADSNNDNHITKIEELKSISRNQIEKIDKTISGLITGLNKLLSDMRVELEDVKNIANEKESRIRRYEDGYDYKILKGFTKELIRITEYAEQNISKDPCVEEIYDDLIILLENEGIEKIELCEGGIYSGNEKIAKIVDRYITNDEEMDSTIKEILNSGYSIYITEDNQKILKPAEVVVYKYKSNEESFPDESTEQKENDINSIDSEIDDTNKYDTVIESLSFQDQSINDESDTFDSDLQDDHADSVSEDVDKKGETLADNIIDDEQDKQVETTIKGDKQ